MCSQAKLDAIYDTALSKSKDTLPSSFIDGVHPSNPLLIKIPPDYCTSKMKIMVFGKETNGWEGNFLDCGGRTYLVE